MNKKFKGQGALEYLLLIGGAVLIAVIVIALLVGMGGQSRDTAQEQADRAQQAADVPQPAQIVSVERDTSICLANPANITGTVVNWRALGEGGEHILYITNNSGTVELYDAILDPTNNTHPIPRLDITVHNAGDCGDSFYAYITTTKNNQTVTSAKFRFGWW
jgi:hypothetical protein